MGWRLQIKKGKVDTKNVEKKHGVVPDTFGRGKNSDISAQLSIDVMFGISFRGECDSVGRTIDSVPKEMICLEKIGCCK